jgi:predicted GNAT superfamily acetyltransferase
MAGQAAHDGVDIRLLSDPADLASVNTLFQQVWGTTEPVVLVDMMRAVAYVGGYVAGAYDATPDGAAHLVGASFGFLADHAGARALHSHVTGILPGLQHAGLGRALKDHQREWAAARGIPWISWTFDPLVRRNAWFNIEVLGAEVAEYVVDFYGSMRDSVNSGTPSDRLVVAWRTGAPGAAPVAPAPAAVRLEVATPDDIVALRRTDPAAADVWLMRVRSELGDTIAAGARVVGFTRGGSYVLDVPT